MYIASQILVVISNIIFVISVFSKSKIGVVTWLIVSDILFAIHYFLLGGFTGSYIVIADIIFLTITYIQKKRNHDKFIMYTGLIFAVISIIIGILTWRGFISIFPMIGMTNYFVCMGINNLLVNKISLAINNTTNTIYMCLLRSYIGAICGTILIICSTTASIQTYITQKKSKTINSNSTSYNSNNKDATLNNDNQNTKKEVD